MLFSAELVLEEKIEYNDLVKSIQDETSSNDDEHSNVQTIQADKQNDVAPKNGKCKLKAKNSVWNIYFILNIKDFHILTLEHVLFGGIIYLFINLWKQNHLSATSFILILFSCFPSVDIFSSVVFFPVIFYLHWLFLQTSQHATSSLIGFLMQDLNWVQKIVEIPMILVWD